MVLHKSPWTFCPRHRRPIQVKNAIFTQKCDIYHTQGAENINALAYSIRITRLKPVSSKYSRNSCGRFLMVMEPCVSIIFCVRSSTRSPDERKLRQIKDKVRHAIQLPDNLGFKLRRGQRIQAPLDSERHRYILASLDYLHDILTKFVAALTNFPPHRHNGASAWQYRPAAAHHP